MLDVLELELNDADLVDSTDADEYSSLVTLYVLTAIEVYGADAVSEKKKQALIDMFMVADARRTKKIIRGVKTAGKVALTIVDLVLLFSPEPTSKGRAAARGAQAASKLSKGAKAVSKANKGIRTAYLMTTEVAKKSATAREKLAEKGIKLPNKGGVGASTFKAVRKTLGAPPTEWPRAKRSLWRRK